MTDRLVDVLNERNTVLHVYPVSIGGPDASPQDAEYERAALKAAAHAHLVSEAERQGLHARMHVDRRGMLTPYGGELD
jgi:hypothetical protein